MVRGTGAPIAGFVQCESAGDDQYADNEDPYDLPSHRYHDLPLGDKDCHVGMHDRDPRVTREEVHRGVVQVEVHVSMSIAHHATGLVRCYRAGSETSGDSLSLRQDGPPLQRRKWAEKGI
jgi:hypothetical protein